MCLFSFFDCVDCYNPFVLRAFSAAVGILLIDGELKRAQHLCERMQNTPDSVRVALSAHHIVHVRLCFVYVCSYNVLFIF